MTLILTLASAVQPWWPGETGGAIGAWLGAGVGVVFGGIAGGVGGPLAAKGLAKRFVIGLYIAAIVCGVALLGAGLVALATKQPYHVYYPLMHPGALLTALASIILPVAILPAYRRAEARRLAAAELRHA